MQHGLRQRTGRRTVLPPVGVGSRAMPDEWSRGGESGPTPFLESINEKAVKMKIPRRSFFGCVCALFARKPKTETIKIPTVAEFCKDKPWVPGDGIKDKPITIFMPGFRD